MAFASAQETARAQITPLNSIVDDQTANVFFEIPHSATDTCIRDYHYIRPLQDVSIVNSSGNYAYWEFSKEATLNTKWILRTQWTPIPVAATSTFARYQDYAGIAEINNIVISYGSNEIYNYYYHWIWVRQKLWLPLEKAAAWLEMVKGEKSEAQRSQLTQAGFITWTNLCVPNSFLRSQCWRIVALSQRLRLSVSFNQIESLLQTDNPAATFTAGFITPLGSTPATQHNLGVDWYHTNDGVTGALVAKTLTEKGVTHLVFYPRHVTFLLNSGSNPVGFAAGTNVGANGPNSGIPLERSGVSRTIDYWITFTVLDPGTAGPGGNYFIVSNNPTPLPSPPQGPLIAPYNPIGTIYMEGNGVFYIRQNVAEFDWMRYFYKAENHSCLPGDNLFFITSSLDCESENANYGNLALVNVDNLQLFIPFGINGTGISPANPELSQTLTLHLLYEKLNFIQFQDHEVNRVFEP